MTLERRGFHIFVSFITIIYKFGNAHLLLLFFYDTLFLLQKSLMLVVIVRMKCTTEQTLMKILFLFPLSIYEKN
jgi:hypothetical protein